MTKADLIAAIEKGANITHKQAESVINICFDSMTMIELKLEDLDLLPIVITSLMREEIPRLVRS